MLSFVVLVRLSSSSLLLPPVVLAWLLLALLGPPYSLLEMSPSAPLLPAMLVAESGLDSDDAALEAETYRGGRFLVLLALLLLDDMLGEDEDSLPLLEPDSEALLLPVLELDWS